MTDTSLLQPGVILQYHNDKSVFNGVFYRISKIGPNKTTLVPLPRQEALIKFPLAQKTFKIGTSYLLEAIYKNNIYSIWEQEDPSKPKAL